RQRRRPLRDARARPGLAEGESRPRRLAAPRARGDDCDGPAALALAARAGRRGGLVDPGSLRRRAPRSAPGRTVMAAAGPPQRSGLGRIPPKGTGARRSDRPGRAARSNRDDAEGRRSPALLLHARLERRLVLPVRPAVLFALPPAHLRPIA